MNICPVTNNECHMTGCNGTMCTMKGWNRPAEMQFIPKRNIVVKYSKKFAYAPYLNEDIGFEMTIAEHENPLDKMQELRQMAEQFHKANNPHLYQEEPPIKITQQRELIVPIPQQYDTKYLRIMGCKTIEELEAIEDITDDLKLVYDSKKKKLQAK